MSQHFLREQGTRPAAENSQQMQSVFWVPTSMSTSGLFVMGIDQQAQQAQAAVPAAKANQ
jgi:hypothetical protein